NSTRLLPYPIGNRPAKPNGIPACACRRPGRRSLARQSLAWRASFETMRHLQPAPRRPEPMTDRKAPRNPHGLFAIEGDCQRPQCFSYLDLAEIHPYYQVADLSTVDEKLSGKAVRLRKLLDLAGPGYGTAWITVESLDGNFAASLPMDDVARTAV